MRRSRDNIAAPDLPPGLDWIGAEPESMPALTAGGPALVHFLDFAQLNSVRTLPYLEEWTRRYREVGLSVIGVQAPRFPFGAEREAVAAGLERLGVSFPVAIDAERDAVVRLWLRRLAEPLPLGARRGAELGPLRRGRIPGRPRKRSRTSCARSTRCGRCRSRWRRCGPSDGARRRVMPPSPELFPGGSWERPWIAGEDGEELAVEYEAGGAWRPPRARGEVAVALDGAPLRTVASPAPGSTPLAAHPRHEPHRVTLRPDSGHAGLVGRLRAGVP